jgi:hypothetical protein
MTRSPIPTHESHQIFWFILNGVTTAVRLFHATGFSTKTINEWARDTGEVDPEGTGGPNPLDRIAQIVGHLATRGAAGEAAIVMMREYLDRLFVSVLGEREPVPLTVQFRLDAVADTLRETSEAAAAAVHGDRDPAEVRREIAEAIASLERLGRIVGSTGTPLRPVA